MMRCAGLKEREGRRLASMRIGRAGMRVVLVAASVGFVFTVMITYVFLSADDDVSGMSSTTQVLPNLVGWCLYTTLHIHHCAAP
jgi:hypothetical protein